MSWPFGDLERGKYGAILVDPPWDFEAWASPPYGKGRTAASHYTTMSMLQLARLPIDELATPNAVLFMWVCWPCLEDAMRLIPLWGFKFKTCAFAWLKADPYRLWALEEDVRMGLGYWTRSNSEVCLLATRGKPKRSNPDVRQGIIEPMREHSRKPDCVHKRIERLVVGPYCELFARQKRSGWDVWGNETDKFAEAAE